MKLLKKIENVFAAVAFAEGGEFETARQMVKEEDDRRGRRPERADARRDERHHTAEPRPART
ncbi:MAG: hypothetical protein Kow0025_19830 [Thermodesulfovibrionales bacterium]